LKEENLMKLTSKLNFLTLAVAGLICCSGCGSGSDDVLGGGPAPVTVKLTAGADTTLRGSMGGTLSRDVCPEDEMLIGVSGSTNGVPYLIGLQAVCGTSELVSAGGGAFRLAFDAGSVLAMRGWNHASGTEFTRTCPDDRVLVGFRGRSGALIDQLTLRCGRVVYVQDGGGGWMHQVEDVLDLDPAGGTGGSEFDQTNCPAGQVARGSNIRHGDGVDAFGMVCATPEPVEID
jgi:hypothetical protein